MKDIHGERKIITNLNRMAEMTATDNEKLQKDFQDALEKTPTNAAKNSASELDIETER